MSDIDEPSYYDESFEFSDECGTADDLAEHVLPSPVWISHDPNSDAESPATDWEDYFCDEFYNEDAIASSKQKRIDRRDAQGIESLDQGQSRKTRCKVRDTRPIPRLKLRERRRAVLEPTVVWKSKSICPSSPSTSKEVVVEGQGKKVALLKDWREKIEVMPSESVYPQQHPFEARQECPDPTDISSSKEQNPESNDCTTSPAPLPPIPSLPDGNKCTPQPRFKPTESTVNNPSPSPEYTTPTIALSPPTIHPHHTQTSQPSPHENIKIGQIDSSSLPKN